MFSTITRVGDGFELMDINENISSFFELPASGFDTSRSKTAMQLGHFLLFSYAERLSQNSWSLLEKEHGGFGHIFKVLSGSDRNLEDSLSYSQLIDGVKEELSFFVNGVEFRTELLQELENLLHPQHILPVEQCWACLSPEEFREQFDLLMIWREGKYLGITDSKLLDNLADCLGDLDGAAGYILAGNPFCSKELLTDLLSSNYVTDYSKLILALNVIHEPESTRRRAEQNLRIKEFGYF